MLAYFYFYFFYFLILGGNELNLNAEFSKAKCHLEKNDAAIKLGNTNPKLDMDIQWIIYSIIGFSWPYFNGQSDLKIVQASNCNILIIAILNGVQFEENPK